MLYQPTIDAVASHDSSLYYHDGVHYLFIQYASARHTGKGSDGMALATSTDGVHFDELGPIIQKSDKTDALGGISRPWKAEERFLLSFSERRGDVQSIFFAESDDLIHWRRLGDEQCFSPDPVWYDDTPAGRWDDLWVLPKEETHGFRGYITARPWSKTAGIAFDSFGLAESEDGVHWRALPPATLDWGEWPPMSIGEVAAVERIGRRYYLLQHYAEHMLGNRQVRKHLGRTEGMYVFVADHPAGPFRPDTTSYRLPPTYNVFMRFYSTAEETLVNHKSVARYGKGSRFWMPPLKKATVDQHGRFRLEYWLGNDALKGPQIPIDLARCTILGVPSYQNERKRGWQMTPQRLEAHEPNSGGVALLSNQFDLDRGTILEGLLRIIEPPNRWSGIGVFIEEDSVTNTGTGIILQTRGRAELGPFRASGSTRVLPYPTFKPDDVVELTVPADRICRFRMLTRRGLLEFYYDELLVQCYSLPREPTGRIGLIVESGTAIFESLQAWGMSL